MKSSESTNEIHVEGEESIFDRARFLADEAPPFLISLSDHRVKTIRNILARIIYWYDYRDMDRIHVAQI